MFTSVYLRSIEHQFWIHDTHTNCNGDDKEEVEEEESDNDDKTETVSAHDENANESNPPHRRNKKAGNQIVFVYPEIR